MTTVRDQHFVIPYGTPPADMPDWDEIERVAEMVRATPVGATCSRPSDRAAARLAGSRFDQAQGCGR